MLCTLSFTDEIQTHLSTSYKTPVVFMFKAKWCKHCSKMEPEFEKLSKKYSMIFVKIDVDDFPEAVTAYEVKGMPSFFCIKNGMIVGDYAGSKIDKLVEVIKKL